MTAPGRAQGDCELATSACSGCAGSIMDMKVQGSRSGKTLGIGELFASVCSATALLDRS